MKVGEITHCDCGHDVVYDGGCTAGYGVDREDKNRQVSQSLGRVLR
jgi:hypothetical protein